MKNSETTATAVLESVKGKKKTGRVYLSKDELCPSLGLGPLHLHLSPDK